LATRRMRSVEKAAGGRDLRSAERVTAGELCPATVVLRLRILTAELHAPDLAPSLWPRSFLPEQPPPAADGRRDRGGAPPLAAGVKKRREDSPERAHMSAWSNRRNDGR
jgi:hypothetical protein